MKEKEIKQHLKNSLVKPSESFTNRLMAKVESEEKSKLNSPIRFLIILGFGLLGNLFFLVLILLIPTPQFYFINLTIKIPSTLIMVSGVFVILTIANWAFQVYNEQKLIS